MSAHGLSHSGISQRTLDSTRYTDEATIVNETAHEITYDIGTSSVSLESCITSLQQHKVPGPWLFHINDFNQLLGQGALFSVYGWSNNTTAIDSHDAIEKAYKFRQLWAIKIPRSGSFRNGQNTSYTSQGPRISIRRHVEATHSEIQVLSYTPFRGHPNIVQLLGWGLCLDELGKDDFVFRIPHLILEKADYSLDGLLQHHSVSFSDKRLLCIDIAEGLRALHNAEISHGDLKPQNILVFKCEKPVTYELQLLKGPMRERYVAKLCDFGLSFNTHFTTQLLTYRYFGTPLWRAPEVLQQDTRHLSPKKFFGCDIFSLGLVIWSIFATNGRPVLTEVMERDGTALEHVDIEAILPERSSHLRRTRKAQKEGKLGFLLYPHKEEHPSTKAVQRPTGDDMFNYNPILIPVDTDRETIKLQKDAHYEVIEERVNSNVFVDHMSKKTPYEEMDHNDQELERIENQNLQNDNISPLLKQTLSNALRNDIKAQAILPQLFEQEGCPFSITHFGPRIGVSHLRRLQWLCNGASSGSLNALEFLRKHMSEKQVDEGATRFHETIAKPFGLINPGVRWRRVFEKEVDNPIVYSINSFRAIGGDNSHFVSSCTRLRPLQSLLNGSEGQDGSSWEFDIDLSDKDDESIKSNLSIHPGDLNSQIRRKLQAFRRNHEIGDNKVLLRGGQGDSLVHCLAALAQLEAFTPASLNIFYATNISGDRHPLLWSIGSGLASVNHQNYCGQTALWQACAAGHAATAMALLKAGADPDIPDLNGITPLHWLFNFLNHEVDSLASAFLGAGTTSYNSSAHTPAPAFHFPFEWPIGTPLHWSIQAGACRAVKALMCLGANVNASIELPNSKKLTALDLAVLRHDHILVKVLIDGGARMENSVKWILRPEWLPPWLLHIPVEDSTIRRNRAFCTLVHLLRPYSLEGKPLNTPFPEHTGDQCIDLSAFTGVVDEALSSRSHITLHSLGRLCSLVRLCCWIKVIDRPSVLQKCIEYELPLPVLRWFTKGEIGKHEMAQRFSGGTLLHFTAGWPPSNGVVRPKYLWYLMENDFAVNEFVEDSIETSFSLLLKNAKIHQQDFIDRFCWELASKPIHRESSPEAYFYITGLLPTEGFGENRFGVTALHQSLMAGNAQAARVFLELGHATNTPMADGRLPIDLIKCINQEDRASILEMLEPHAPQQSTSPPSNWRTIQTPGKEAFYHEINDTITLERPAVDPYVGRSLILGWQDGATRHITRMDTQSLFWGSRPLLPVLWRTPLDRDTKDSYSLHQVTPEQGAVLKEEKNDRLALHELSLEEKFYNDWFRDIERIYSAFSIQNVARKVTDAGPSTFESKGTAQYDTMPTYPINWNQDTRGPFCFYHAGLYDNLRGFNKVIERTYLDQMLMEATVRLARMSPEEIEACSRRPMGSGRSKDHNVFVNDLDNLQLEPRDRQSLPMIARRH